MGLWEKEQCKSALTHSAIKMHGVHRTALAQLHLSFIYVWSLVALLSAPLCPLCPLPLSTLYTMMSVSSLFLAPADMNCIQSSILKEKKLHPAQKSRGAIYPSSS